MNIAILGSSGYLGSAIARRLAEIGTIRVFGVDVRSPTAPYELGVFERMDIRNPRVGRFLKDCSVDTVIHLAFVMPPIRNVRMAYDIDVNGMRNVLECCAHAGVSKVIVASSTTVYGARPDNPERLTEDCLPRGAPGYYYADHKIEVERICREFSRSHPQIVLTVLRMCYIYGPFVRTFYSKQFNAKRVYLFKGFDPPTQFLHEQDLGEASALAAGKDGAGTYNVVPDDAVRLSDAVVSAGRSVKWVELSPRTLAFIGMMNKLKIIDTPVASMEYWKYSWAASNERFKKDFDFRPRYGSKEAFLSFSGGKP